MSHICKPGYLFHIHWETQNPSQLQIFELKAKIPVKNWEQGWVVNPMKTTYQVLTWSFVYERKRQSIWVESALPKTKPIKYCLYCTLIRSLGYLLHTKDFQVQSKEINVTGIHLRFSGILQLCINPTDHDQIPATSKTENSKLWNWQGVLKALVSYLTCGYKSCCLWVLLNLISLKTTKRVT
jgi:hypothetical protein